VAAAPAKLAPPTNANGNTMRPPRMPILSWILGVAKSCNSSEPKFSMM
jgi:hypothetical protein